MKTILKKIMSSVLALAGTITLFSVLSGLSVNASVITPRLIVTGSEIDPGNVKAGEDFKLVIHMKNESKSKLTNIKFTFSTPDNEIVPKSGSDSLYMESVDKEETFDIEVGMKTRKDLDPKTYSVTLNYSYEEDNWRSFEDTVELPVPVVVIPSLSITELKVTRDTIVIEGKTSCSLNVNNTGKCSISNVTVSLEGDNIENTKVFLGRLEADASAMADMTIKSASLGEGDVVAKVTYEDNEGNVYTEKEILRINVIEPVVEIPVEETPVYMDYRIWIAAGIILIVIIIVTVIRKKREKAYA